MIQKRINLPQRYLVGITVQTSNSCEMNPETAKIMPTIERYTQEKIAERIPNRLHPGVMFCAYTHYETDESGLYTYFVGEEVTCLPETLTSELTALIGAAGPYMKFTEGPGPMPTIVISLWQKIWAMEEKILGGKRAFATDFEVYDHRARDPKNTTFDLFVGLKSEDKES